MTDTMTCPAGTRLKRWGTPDPAKDARYGAPGTERDFRRSHKGHGGSRLKPLLRGCVCVAGVLRA
ncbi:MAG: hypothetical protein L0K86_29650, partial [Actinomycetia bacterium]|nr:hypothetical protein [Actinomycetes bacterium]